MLSPKVSLLCFTISLILRFYALATAQSVNSSDNTQTQLRAIKVDEGTKPILLETESYNSFKQLMSLFPNKTVHVDLWAAWCKPCLIEFEKQQALQNLTQNKSVELLYVSIDRTNYKGKWLRTIKKYGLSGYHIIANRELQKDMWKAIHDQEARLSIPYYFVSDQIVLGLLFTCVNR